jgi:integrase
LAQDSFRLSTPINWTLTGHFMAPRLRSPTLESRTARLRLKVRRKPYFLTVAPGVSLGYRRNLGAGAWLVRCADGKGGGWTKGFAVADDFEDARGEQVIDFWAAQVRARELVRGKHTDASKPATVGEALDEYERDLLARGGYVTHVKRVRARLVPALLDRPVGLLVMRELRRWRDSEVARGLQHASVTRTCKAFAGALNYMANLDPTIANRSAWRLGLAALPDSQVARLDAILSDDDVRAVVAACYAFDQRLGLFVEVLALTGCRPIQAARLVVGDLQADRVLMPRSAKGKGTKKIDRRPVPIPPALIAKLRAVAGKQAADAPLLLRPDGQSWLKNHNRPFQKALAAAGFAPSVVPYSLRHSSIVRSLLHGLPARLVADAHDTSVGMLERTYAKYIADHSDTALRAAQIDLTPTSTGPVVVPLARRKARGVK